MDAKKIEAVLIANGRHIDELEVRLTRLEKQVLQGQIFEKRGDIIAQNRV